MPPRYDLLALDLDGTLLGPDGKVSPANKQALIAARAAGLTVIICTGRGFAECVHILESINQLDPVIVAGGSIIACPQKRATLHRFPIRRELVSTSVDRVLASGHVALVYKDSSETNYDYLVVRGHQNHQLDPVTTWWFKDLRIHHRFITTLQEDEHPEHTVRIGACGRPRDLASIRDDITGRIGGEAVIHHFPAQHGPDHDKNDLMHVLEIFDSRATKWNAVIHLANQRSINPARIAAIGDEINDLPMIAGAALGIAMGNAVPEIAAVAGKKTKSHAEDGVAWAVERILRGEW